MANATLPERESPTTPENQRRDIGFELQSEDTFGIRNVDCIEGYFLASTFREQRTDEVELGEVVPHERIVSHNVRIHHSAGRTAR